MSVAWSLLLLCFLGLGATPAFAAADSDRDGVVDASDECPETEPGAPVTMRGCPYDSDGDDVPDYRDDCPGSVNAPRVDAWGCALATEIVLEGLSFEVNSASLRKDSYAVLERAAKTLLDYERLRAEVAGHTDDRGPAAHNRQLSRARADAVRAHLIEAGVAASSVTARGYGESRPIADNDTEAGRRANRRVVLRILEGEAR